MIGAPFEGLPVPGRTRSLDAREGTRVTEAAARTVRPVPSRRPPARPSLSSLRPGLRPARPEDVDRSVRRRIALAWGLLFLNTLTYVSGLALIPLPSSLGKACAQGSLPLAVLVLLSVNRRVAIRPNTFLCLMSLLVLDTLVTGVLPMQLGTLYRTVRLVAYVGALWLSTPWWGRADLLVLRWHLRFLHLAVASALVGLVISPGAAFAFDGRLTGVIWPMFPTQLAQYAALVIGLSVLLWLGRLGSGRGAALGAALGLPTLYLCHTRTAFLGLVAGLVVAGASMAANNSRVRRFFLATSVVVAMGALVASAAVAQWLTRGQSAEGLTTLTGRTNFWTLVLDEPRTPFEMTFGFGLSNASVNGLPIDSNWLAAYQQEGVVGVVVCAAVLVALLVGAVLQPPGLRRALLLFVVTYCAIASATEDAFTNASTYLLDLAAAASLMVVVRNREGGT